MLLIVIRVLDLNHARFMGRAPLGPSDTDFEYESSGSLVIAVPSLSCGTRWHVLTSLNVEPLLSVRRSLTSSLYLGCDIVHVNMHDSSEEQRTYKPPRRVCVCARWMVKSASLESLLPVLGSGPKNMSMLIVDGTAEFIILRVALCISHADEIRYEYLLDEF